MKIRCRVCDGCGAVPASFGTGYLPDEMGDRLLKPKPCPGCQGTGMQDEPLPTILIECPFAPPPLTEAESDCEDEGWAQK